MVKCQSYGFVIPPLTTDRLPQSEYSRYDADDALLVPGAPRKFGRVCSHLVTRLVRLIGDDACRPPVPVPVAFSTHKEPATKGLGTLSRDRLNSGNKIGCALIHGVLESGRIGTHAELSIGK